MTMQQLQEYLEREGRKISEDGICSYYKRCRFCIRYLPYPCAEAHNRLVGNMRLNDDLGDDYDDLLSEPPVRQQFGSAIAFDEETLNNWRRVANVRSEKSGEVRLASLTRKA